MTSPDPTPQQWMTAPIIDYEPAPEPLRRRQETQEPLRRRQETPVCPTPSVAALHRPSPRPLLAHRAPPRLGEPQPPKSAVVFAETALRQVIEVIDRRRPVAQLRPLMTPVLVDRVIALTGVARTGSATMRRVRVRSVDGGIDENGDPAEIRAAEVFASFTRSGRVHAVAARIERHQDRWRLVALHIG